MDKAQYRPFVDALLAGEKTIFKEWEANTPYFDGCLPDRGDGRARARDLALRPDEAGRARPTRTTPGRAPLRGGAVAAGQCAGHAVEHGGLPDQAQTRRAGRASSASIPGLEKAEFARLGGLHRNTFLNSPKLLDGELRLTRRARLRFAGQITGVRRLCRERRHRTAGGPAAAA